MRNVEIKARVRDVDDFSARLKALKPIQPRVFVQEDIFFRFPGAVSSSGSSGLGRGIDLL